MSGRVPSDWTVRASSLLGLVESAEHSYIPLLRYIMLLWRRGKGLTDLFFVPI